MYKTHLENLATTDSPTANGQRLFGLIQDKEWAREVSVICSPKERIRGRNLHPCVIDGVPTIIHGKNLSNQHPFLYGAIQEFAAENGYQLLKERRSGEKLVGFERRTWLPMMVFTVGMNSAVASKDLTAKSSTTLALYDPIVSEKIIDAPQPQSISLNRSEPIPTVNNAERHDKAHQDDETAVRGVKLQDHLDSWIDDNFDQMLVAEIQDILSDHYVDHKKDPEYIESDLQEMAAYFSRYPQAVTLLRDLKDANWTLRFSPETFKTRIVGNQFQVQAAKVYFDSRSAAQLRSHKSCGEKLAACIASPADALLHELLHARAALLEPTVFIKQGGLNGVIYPFAHEHAVIQEENRLYESMSEVDGRLRPQRHRHAGRLAASNCVTCIQ